MGLDVPELDDRTFADLLEDARKRIPVYSEEWTDHNAHDPGITVLELLAWLAESYGYQLDRVTDDHRRAYLDLVGVSPRPPRPATADLVVDPPVEFGGETGVGTGTRLPAETPVTVETRDGSVVRFETADDVTLTRARIASVVSDHDRGRIDHTTANERDGAYFLAFGPDARPESTLYLGFDGDPFEAADRLELTLDFHEANLDVPAADDDGTFEPSIRVAWQHCTRPEAWYLDDAWDGLTVRRDGTNHFYRGGRVILETPRNWRGEPTAMLDRDRELYWLRCTPRVRGERSAGVAATEGDRDTPQYEIPPQFDAVRTNVVPAVHRETVAEVVLERADGIDGAGGDDDRTTADANQRFRFPRGPVLEATVAVDGEPWERVDRFAASGPEDRHYVLDECEGVVRFGDGRRGAIPPVGRRVVARSVVYGGGREGNVPSDSRWRFAADEFDSFAVEPLERPSDGRDAESIDAAFVRAIDEREVPHRAVTADDVRELAIRTPGLRVGRAGAFVDDPDGADGSRHVTVVVVPYSPPPARPVPTRGFLEAVECHLRNRTLLTDRVSVVGPTYVGVDVTAEVSVAAGFDAADRRAVAEERLTTFLDPIDGFDRDGWPFGRPVYVSELYEVLDGVSGIDAVADVSVTVDGETTLETDATALPDPRTVDVVVRSDRRGCEDRTERGF